MNYKRYTGTLKLSDVLHSDYYLLPLVHRFDIQFGVGDMTIAELCTKNNLDQEFFVELLNVYHDEYYFPENTLLRLDMRLVVEYLRKTHQYYVEYLLPSIRKLIAGFIRTGGKKNHSLAPIGQLYHNYEAEFLRHIEREETNVFPFALRINALYHSKSDTPRLTARNSESIRRFESEHRLMDEKIFDIKNILIKYIEPPYDVHLCNTIIFELDRLERDVIDHSRIEDRILFASSVRMEEELKKRARKTKRIPKRGTKS